MPAQVVSAEEASVETEMLNKKTLPNLWRYRCFHPYTLLVLIVVISVLTTTYRTLFGGHDVQKEQVIIIQPSPPADSFRLFKDNGKLHSCKIPRVPLYPQSFLHLRPASALDPALRDCQDMPEVATLENDVLRLRSDMQNMSCCAREVYRPLNDPTDSFKLGNCQKFSQEGTLDVSRMEFIAVECLSDVPESNNELNQMNDQASNQRNESSNDGQLILVDAFYGYYANVPLSSERLQPKLKHWEGQPEPEKPESIFLLVLDSTSRNEAYRSLPMTIKFLTNKLGFVDFKGHHPMGEPTLKNAAPMLMGMTYKTLRKKYHRKWEEHWDQAPFIWKTFERLQYVTGYFEDLPRIATFNYGGQRGFLRQPVDLYSRPLMLVHNETFSHYEKKICIGNQSLFEFSLDYHFRALERLHHVPTFFISWPCWPWHDHASSLQLFDNDLLQFFQRVATAQNGAILDRTWIILTGDHSFYNDAYARASHEGLLERRNMPLLIRPPNRALSLEPNLFKILNHNSRILTSHFDIHRTLFAIAARAGSAEQGSSDGYGASLLEPLDSERSCAEAGIPAPMCACNLPLPTGGQWNKRQKIDPLLRINLTTKV